MATHPRAHAISDVGLTRSNNQDSGYAGHRLFVVADGMGGHAGGDVASALAIRSLRELDREFDSPSEAELALRNGLVEAQEAIADTVAGHPELAGMGTTVSAVALLGDTAVIAHIGDSRVYRFRGGVLEQMTNDHTFVQRLVETGRITAEEAAHHPRRSVLMRVLGDIDQTPEVDTESVGTRPGDRWLICSDGLSSCVAESEIRRILAARHHPSTAAEALLKETLANGAPDNVTIVVVDVRDEEEPPGEPIVVGSATQPLKFSPARVTRSQPRLPALLRHPLRSTPLDDSHFEPETDEFLDALVTEDRRRLRRRRATAITLIVLAILAVVAGLWLAYQWTQTRYFVGPYQGPVAAYEGKVAVFQGVQQDLGPISLHSLAYVVDDLDLTDLPTYRRNQVEQTISLDSLAEADATVKELRDAALH
ncbi:MAG: serine/threonine-protein phosphatase [Microbacteriaceae bacterium]|nr:serine/threonine-protein phosphatase [Microbacteriaceae bacterium]